MDLWRLQTLVFIIPTIGYVVSRGLRGPVLAKLTWLYFLSSAAFVTFYTGSMYGQLQGRIDHTSALALVLLFFIPACIFSANRKHLICLGFFFELLMGFNAGLLFLNGYGIFNAHSIDATVCLMILPYYALSRSFHWGNLLSIGFVLYASLSTGATTPYYMVCAIMIAILWQRNRVKTLVLAVAGLGGIAYRVLGSDLYYTSGRIQVWKDALTWWHENTFTLVGSGIGTYEWLGPYIQAINKNTHAGYFLWAHNDYLQILFEGGVIGLILFLTLAGMVVLRAREHKILLPCLAAIGVAMIAQSPLHWFLSSLWIAFIARLSLEE